MGKGLSVKEATGVQLMSLFSRFGLGNLLRHFSPERHNGIDAVILI